MLKDARSYARIRDIVRYYIPVVSPDASESYNIET